MRPTWRWFGPIDSVSTEDMLQAGVKGVVSALHHVPTGAVWSREEIARRQAEIAQRPRDATSGLVWEVVESLPISEAIKQQRGPWREHLDAYRASLANLAAAGLEVICYNLMPVLDWTRTDLAWRVPHGGACMRFDLVDFAAFDVGVLARPSAADDYAPEVATEAARRHAAMDDAARARLTRNIAFGLPGVAESLTLDDLRAHLGAY